ncbi:MAG: Cna B-type domain-containing protein, partial [Clostridiales bacterium]|nr:Cna B-type domain-containing protein [Clostridiales bacterium]
MRMKRWMALLLAAVMLLSALPGALAVDNGDVKISGSCPSEDAKMRNNGHHFYFAEVDEPRCIESGTVWWFCTYCGDEYEETLPALGHDFRNDWSVTYEASCDSDGMQIRFCHRCQQEEVRSIPALGHSWQERTIRRVEPTCTEDGYREYTRQCTRCGMYDGASAVGTTTSQRQTLPALGHDWGPWKVEYPGTCTEKGMNVRKCNRCGKEEYVYSDYSDHQWGPWKVEYPGTCLEKGMNVRKCALCGKEEYVYSDYGDHEWGEWEVVTPAGPGAPGLEKRVCKNTPNHVEQREIPPLPKAQYVLKGVEKTYYGSILDSLGGWYPDIYSSGAFHIIWEDAEPILHKEYYAATGPFYKDSGHDTLLTDEPVAGETYYFAITVYNDISREDHSIDFSQVNSDLVNVTIQGFDVTYLWFEADTTDEFADACTLHFSAACLGKPELTLTWQFDGDGDTNQYDRDEFLPQEIVGAWHAIKNTGSVDLTVGWHVEFGDGYAFTAGPEHYFGLAAGKDYGTGCGGKTVGEHIDPGTATETLLGTSTITFWYIGYDRATGEKLCESNHITRVWKVRKAEEPNGVVGISKIDADNKWPLFGAFFQVYDDEDAIIAEWESQDSPFFIDGLKTGCEYTLVETKAPDGYTLALPMTFTIDASGAIATGGGDSIPASFTSAPVLTVENRQTQVSVAKQDADTGELLSGAKLQIIDETGAVVEEWESTDGVHSVFGLRTGRQYTLAEAAAPAGYDAAPSATFTIDETGKVTTTGDVTEDSTGVPVLVVKDHRAAGTPDEEKAELTLTYVGVSPDKEVYDPDDILIIYYEVENTGNVPLKVDLWADDYPDGKAFTGLMPETVLQPGEKLQTARAQDTAKQYVKPGTATAELLGIDEVTAYAYGYDPDNYTHGNSSAALCKSNEVTNEFKVGGGTNGDPGGTPDEEKAELTVYLEAQDYDTHAPKTQFQDGESYFFYGIVENTGNVPLELYDFDVYYSSGFSEAGRNIEGQRAVLQPGEKTAYVGGSYWFISAGGKISASDVAPGTETYILAGTMTYSVNVRGYKPDTDEVLCSAEGSCSIGLLWEGLTPEDIASLSVRKVWDDNDDQIGARPEYVNVYLLWDGAPMAMAKLYEDNGWTATFDDMPLIDPEDGHTIEYTWQEDDVESYILTSVSTEGFLTTLTNTYNPGSAIQEPDKAALTLTWVRDSDVDYAPYPGDEHQPDDSVWVDFTAENTGAVPLDPVLRAEYANGVTYQRTDYPVMEPEETRDDSKGTLPIGDFITPGTDTAELLGTVTLTFWYDGLDPETGEKLCESNKITRVWKVGKDGTTTTGDPNTLNPAISVTISAEPGAGDGKRYEGAKLPYHYEVTNTGNCPVYVPWWPDVMPEVFDASAPNGRTEVPEITTALSFTLLYPGETYSHMDNYTVSAADAEHGSVFFWRWGDAWYSDTDGELQYIDAKSNELRIAFTYPEGGDPDPDAAKLEIVWNYDEIWDDSMELLFDTTAPGVLTAEDSAYAWFTVTNTGNVPLEVYDYVTWGDGHTDSCSPYRLSGSLDPGKFEEDFWGDGPLGDYITPGTDTAELMGTVTVTFWAKGFDPETGEQLCETEHLSRTWEVRNGPAPWPIPEESRLTVSISEASSRTDPAGYQLTEYWDTAIYVRNEGPVDVPEYTLHVDFVASNEGMHTWNPDATDGATWYEFTIYGIASLTERNACSSPFGTIIDQDVARGYVQATAYVTWIDPDSEEPRESNHDTVYLPVISKTGLLLKKGIEKGPANTKYFQEDEPINWTLTVTNTSKEPIYNVVVMDQGVKVGEFPVIHPGETLPCTVPPHVVSAYEADVAMTVVNIATATGQDLQGAEHTWISNPVSVPTNEFSPVPIPPVFPPEDPGKTPEDPGPGKPIDPPPEDPKKDKEKDKDGDPFIKGDGGDSCLLTLTALSDAEARYTLHACAEHLAAAQAAQEATANSPDAGWDQAAEIWRAEIDKLYDVLREAAVSDEAKAAVTADQEAYWAYIDA